VKNSRAFKARLFFAFLTLRALASLPYLFEKYSHRRTKYLKDISEKSLSHILLAAPGILIAGDLGYRFRESLVRTPI
jgi:hypothetical protein